MTKAILYAIISVAAMAALLWTEGWEYSINFLETLGMSYDVSIAVFYLTMIATLCISLYHSMDYFENRISSYKK